MEPLWQPVLTSVEIQDPMEEMVKMVITMEKAGKMVGPQSREELEESHT